MTNKPLKDQNIARLVSVWIWNAIIFDLAFLGLDTSLMKWQHILAAPKWQQLLVAPLAAAGVIILNGILGPNAKARVVFLWRKHPHPAMQAYSKLARSDVRISMDQLREVEGGTLPSSPSQQNRSWYKRYGSVQNDPAVLSLHRDYLYARDYSSMIVIFGVPMTIFGYIFAENSGIFTYYTIFMVLQYALVTRAAVQYGDRFVTTALAKALTMEK